MDLPVARRLIRPFLDRLNIDPLDTTADFQRLTRDVTASLIRFDNRSFSIMMGTNYKLGESVRDALCREHMPRLVQTLRDAGHTVDTDLFGDPTRIIVVTFNEGATQ